MRFSKGAGMSPRVLSMVMIALLALPIYVHAQKKNPAATPSPRVGKDNKPVPGADAATRIVSRHCQEGQGRCAVPGRLDHRRLGGTGQESLEQAFRSAEIGEFRHRRRSHRTCALAYSKWRTRRHFAQSGRAHDRHQQLAGEFGRANQRRHRGHRQAIPARPRRIPMWCCWRCSRVGPSPKRTIRKKLSGINDTIAKLAKDPNVHYLDIGSKFTEDDGSLTKRSCLISCI